jgi:hypothetical protein
MGLFSGELQKMKIIAYTDKSFSTKKPDVEPYEVLINPETYSITYGTASVDQTAQGKSETQSAFSNRRAQGISFKFLFDGTGVIKKDMGLLAGPCFRYCNTRVKCKSARCG